MSIQDLGAIGELLAAIATLATLVYLALQIKQNTRAVKTSVADSVLNSAQTSISLLTDTPTNAYVWTKGATEYDSLTDEQQDQYRLMMIGQFNTSDMMYWNYRKGTLDEELWSRQETWIAGWLTHPNALSLWDSYKVFVTPAFADYVDAQIRPGIDKYKSDVPAIYDNFEKS